MDPNESRLPAPPNGRSPADLTKKELVAHLTAASDIPRYKLNALTRKALVALFDLPLDEALAAAHAGRPNGRKPKGQPPPTAVYEHFLTGRVQVKR